MNRKGKFLWFTGISKPYFTLWVGFSSLKKTIILIKEEMPFTIKGLKKKSLSAWLQIKIIMRIVCLKSINTLKTHCCIITNTSCKLEHVFLFCFLSFWLNHLSSIVYSIWKKRSLSFGIFSAVNRLKIIDQTSRVFSLDILWKLDNSQRIQNKTQKPSKT